MGNFLLGMCKIHQKQSAYFEEHSRDLHDNLMCAFSNKDDAEQGRPARASGGADGRLDAMAAADDALVVDEELEKVLASRRHLAPLEDITLKPAFEDALAAGEGMLLDTFGATSAGDQAALLKLTKQTKRAFLGEALPLMSASDTLVPLVDIPAEARLPEGGGDALGPLDMDLDPLAVDDIDMRGDALEDEEGAVVGAGPEDGPIIKKRRKAFMFDDPAEIPKEVYQGYMNDRTAITKKDEYDSTILLPYNHPSMPHFMTTYTDMCNSLIQGLSWGSQVAERRRTVMAMAEASGMPTAFPGMWTEGPPGAAPLDMHGSQLHSDDVFLGLDQPGAGAIAPFSEDAGRWEASHAKLDLTDAPTRMGGVVTAGTADEENTQAEAARVGYSGRTEKMHKFLAKEFQRSDSGEGAAASSSAVPSASTLSYDQMCKSQSGGDRGVIAGCFFELLVLRTNGVVNLKQEQPYSDIRIEKARSWGATS